MVGLSITKLTPFTGFSSWEGECDTLPGRKATPDNGRMSSHRELTAIQYGDGVS